MRARKSCSIVGEVLEDLRSWLVLGVQLGNVEKIENVELYAVRVYSRPSVVVDQGIFLSTEEQPPRSSHMLVPVNATFAWFSTCTNKTAHEISL